VTLLFYLIGDQFGPLGWTLYHFLWQGMLVAALHSAACMFCEDGARRRYSLACVFLLVAIVLPAWQIWMILVRHHGLGLGIGPPESLLPWMTVAALFWLCVAPLMSVTTILRGQSLSRQWLADAVDDTQLSEAAASVATQMGFKRTPRVLRSGSADVVAVVGWWHPVIVVPARMPRSLKEVQWRALLAHELAHVRRRDPLINLGLTVMESLVLFHPAAARLAGEVRRMREYCCDDVAVEICGDPLAYARELTMLARMPRLNTRAALYANGGDLKARVVRLVQKRNLVSGRLSDGRKFIFWLASAATIVGVAEIVCRLM
jgi:bla regulator protein BlaR1